MNIFEIVKRQIDLADILRQEHPGGHIGKAGRSRRCNPCPLCSHNDCFTFTSNRYYCFSCGEKGDVIDLLQKTRHITNVEALRYLGNIIGVSFNGDLPRLQEGSVHYRGVDDWQSGDDRTRPDRGRGRIISEKKREEFCRLRRVAADFYHEQLLKNADALHYQMEIRRHSRAILETCLVGYTTGGLLCHITRKGEDPIAFMEIGLVRQAGRILQEYLPRSCFIYPHFSGERILFFTQKDPSGKCKFQIPKWRELPDGETIFYPDPAWITYGQDGLLTDGCWITEGENDRISVMDAGERHVVSTLGNFARPEMTTWLKHHAARKTFFLCFDDDDAGKMYENYYTCMILNPSSAVIKFGRCNIK